MKKELQSIKNCLQAVVILAIILLILSATAFKEERVVLRAASLALILPAFVEALFLRRLEKKLMGEAKPDSANGEKP
jgi:hypothetical protein